MSDQIYRFRPLPTWPYPRTKARRSRWTFKAPWSDTLDLLAREIRMLGGRNLVIGAGFREQDLRLDGLPRSGARDPDHPGIEISFDAVVGGRRQRLVYATDVCERWEHNARPEQRSLVECLGRTLHGIAALYVGDQLSLVCDGADSLHGTRVWLRLLRRSGTHSR